jgi:hypothetical protein
MSRFDVDAHGRGGCARAQASGCDGSTRLSHLRSANSQLSAPDTICTGNTECPELLDLAEELQDAAIRLHSAFNRGGTALESGDIEAAIEMVERARSLARGLRQPSVFWLANMMGTARRILEGALEKAEQDALETLRLGQAANQDAEARISPRRCS